MSLKIVYLGAKAIGTKCFRFLLENAMDLNYNVCAVRSRETEAGKDILRLAEKQQIPVLKSLEDIPECDIIFSVQHHELLKERHLQKAGEIALNLHLAPLPEYRGCNQFTFAILENAVEFGVTIHEMDTRIDHGAILAESRFPVPENCWVKTLYDLSEDKALKLFQDTLPDIITGNYVLKPQHELESLRPSQLHFREEIEDIKEIPLHLPAEEIGRRLRATMMPGFEPPYCRVGGQKVYFTK
ncbi:MAG TPA: formyltransferase family protein [Edaphocola sp.]|nr:formyltransferase family protein [Edaphocola sp.]